MKPEILRRTWAEIDLDALGENYRTVRRSMAAGAKLCCVVKADGYGHGAVMIAQTLAELGADFFGVSNLEEALQLRKSGIQVPILILGYTPVDYVEVLAKQRIAQCVYAKDYARLLSGEARKRKVCISCHLKIDTGMSRLGLSPTEEIQEILTICRLPGLDFQGLFTHFAVSDEGEKGRDFTLNQYASFQELRRSLENHGKTFEICHCANSGGILDYPQTHCDMVRGGIILYGLYPSDQIRHRPPLKPVMSLKSVVSQVKEIRKGDSVSYGRIFTAEKSMKIAAVPIGYADGYPRILGEQAAQVLVGGKRCRITGRVCMDQTLVDVSELPRVKIGDELTLIGREGEQQVTADELAAYARSINYELVCDIGKRVPRVYLRGGKAVSALNLYGEFLSNA